MMTRKFIQGLLLAALVPVAFIGVKSWRYDREAEPAVSAPPVHTIRPQLGHARRGGVPPAPQARDVERAFSTTTSAADNDDQESDETPHAAEDTASQARGAAPPVMAATTETTRDDQPSTRTPLTGAFARAPARMRAPHTSTASATPGSPLVEFVGVMQNETLLKSSDLPAESVRQLKVIVWWSAPGAHFQRLEFFTPTGTLYRRVVTDFTGSVSGVRAPVETVLPIGGSWITEHSLFGAWRVDVYLDNNKTAATTAGFVLNP